jgi:hypothetical protein
MEKVMKRALLGCALVAAFTFAGLGENTAEAGGIRFSFGSGGHGHHNHGSHGYYGQSYGSPYGGSYYGTGSYYGGGFRSSSGWGRGHSHWHDTSHYDYHPGQYVRHRGHYDYVPGHYDYHRSGHWDRH